MNAAAWLPFELAAVTLGYLVTLGLSFSLHTTPLVRFYQGALAANALASAGALVYSFGAGWQAASAAVVAYMVLRALACAFLCWLYVPLKALEPPRRRRARR